MSAGIDARKLAFLAYGRGRAGGHASLGPRRSARVFELATRDEPAWLVARREPAQHALGTLYSLDKLSGKAYRARAGRLGRDGALNATMTTPIGSPAAGLRGALLDGRLLSNLSTVSFTSLLSLQPQRGPAPAASLRQGCLRLRHAHRLVAYAYAYDSTWDRRRRRSSAAASIGRHGP